MELRNIVQRATSKATTNSRDIAIINNGSNILDIHTSFDRNVFLKEGNQAGSEYTQIT